MTEQIKKDAQDSKHLTKKQKAFADEYLETGNGTQAALKVYDTESVKTAATLASENIRKPKVQQYLEDKAERAAEVIFELLENAQNETVKLNAGKDILDRAGLKPTDKSENTSTVKIIESSKEGIDKYKLYEINKSTSTDIK